MKEPDLRMVSQNSPPPFLDKVCALLKGSLLFLICDISVKPCKCHTWNCRVFSTFFFFFCKELFSAARAVYGLWEVLFTQPEIWNSIRFHHLTSSFILVRSSEYHFRVTLCSEFNLWWDTSPPELPNGPRQLYHRHGYTETVTVFTPVSCVCRPHPGEEAVRLFLYPWNHSVCLSLTSLSMMPCRCIPRGFSVPHEHDLRTSQKLEHAQRKTG